MGTTVNGVYLPDAGESGWGPNVTQNFRRLDYGLTEVRYAHPSGSNSNDGLSWGSAKQYILNAYDALPAAGGTVRIANGTKVGGEVAQQGIWLVGPNDVAFASPPTGWRQQKDVRFVGEPASAGIQFAKPGAAIDGGTSIFAYDDLTKPAIWLAGTTSSLVFEDLQAQYPTVGVRAGVGTNGDRSVNTSLFQCRNVAIATYNTGVNKSTPGNPVDIGYVFWAYFEHCVFLAYAPAAKTADSRAAILVKPDPAQESAGLLYFNHTITASGGLKYYRGATTWGLDVNDFVHEGQLTDEPPAVWLVDPNTTGRATLNGVQHADVSAASDSTIKIGNGGAAAKITVTDCAGVVEGPATVFGGYSSPTRLAVHRAAGFQFSKVGARIVAQHDGHRRQFGPTAVRWANLADQDVTTWSSKNGTATVTTGQTDPTGLTNAARLSAGSLDNRQVYRASRTIAVGDWFVCGVWCKGEGTMTGISTGTMDLTTNPAGAFVYTSGASTLSAHPDDAGEWTWLLDAGKVVTVTTSPAEIIFALRCDSGKDRYYFAPMLLHIPAATFSDDEVMEIVDHLGSWDNNLTQGDVGLLKNQNLVFPGSGYIQFSEQADAAAPAANKARLYSKDNGAGKTQLVVRFPTGAVQVIATEP